MKIEYVQTQALFFLELSPTSKLRIISQRHIDCCQVLSTVDRRPLFVDHTQHPALCTALWWMDVMQHVTRSVGINQGLFSLQRTQMGLKDGRIKLMNQILSGVKVSSVQNLIYKAQSVCSLFPKTGHNFQRILTKFDMRHPTIPGLSLAWSLIFNSFNGLEKSIYTCWTLPYTGIANSVLIRADGGNFRSAKAEPQADGV